MIVRWPQGRPSGVPEESWVEDSLTDAFGVAEEQVFAAFFKRVFPFNILPDPILEDLLDRSFLLDLPEPVEA